MPVRKSRSSAKRGTVSKTCTSRWCGPNSMDRVLAILNKEWREALKNGMLLFSGIILALVFTAIPLIFLKIGSSIPIQPGQDWRRVTPPGARDNPALAGLEGRELIQAYLGSQVTV